MGAASASGRLLTVAATAFVMLLLDLTWLGIVAGGFYDRALGPLKRADVFLPAAAAFYALYVGAIVTHAVLGARDRGDAVWRGAGLGLVAYGTFDLTCWAVLRDWPGVLVPVDMAWGVVLTATVAWIGKRVLDAVS